MDLSPLSVPMWVMAVVSVLDALVLVTIGIVGILIYTRVMAAVSDLQKRQIEPIREKMDAILTDLKSVTARANQQAERVDTAINGTIERVDETAARVRAGVHDKVNRAAGVVRGVRAVIVSLLVKESHA